MQYPGRAAGADANRCSWDDWAAKRRSNGSGGCIIARFLRAACAIPSSRSTFRFLLKIGFADPIESVIIAPIPHCAESPDLAQNENE